MLDAVADFVLRFVGHFIVETLFLGVFYRPGWLILRVITFGRYPPQQGEPHNREAVAMVALAALIAGVVFYYS
jgi:hypothetical protein